MEGVLVIKKVSVKLFSFFNGGSIGDQENVCQTLELLYWREYWWSRTCLSNSSASLMEGVLVIKNVSVKLFSFFNGGSIGDEGLVCQTLQFLRWRQYWWSRTCLSNSSASSMEGVLVMKNVSVNFTASLTEGVLVMKNVSVKLFSFFGGGSIGDQERVCQTLQLHQWREYWWWRTCLSNSSASSMEGVLVIKTCLPNFTASSTEGVLVMKNVSVKLFSFFGGGSIGDQERVCQWREYWWWRTCLSNSSASSMEGVLVIKTCLPNFTASSTEGVLVMKNVSVKLFSFFGGGSIGDQERVCQSLQSNSSNFIFFNGGSIGDQNVSPQERVCQTLQFLQWRQYWWSRTCLSNSSASSTEGVLVTKDLSVKLFSFFGGGSIGDQERVCQTLQLHQWREYWWWRTCLSNSSASSMEGVLVIKTCLPNFTASSTEGVLVMKNVSVKLFSYFSGGSIGDQERVCQTLQFHQWREYWRSKRVCPILQLLQRREYWWWRTCLSNSSVSSVEAVLVIKNVSVKLFSFINGGSIGDQERVCQTLRLLYWREYWWSWTCLSNSSTSSMEGVLVIKNLSVKLSSFFIGWSIGDQERVCQTLQLH